MAAAAPIFGAIKAFGATLLGGGAAGGTAAAAGGAGALGTAAKLATVAAGVGGAAAALRRPNMPDVPSPLPTPDQEQIDLARRRRIAGEQRMAGVASTLLGGGAGGTLG